MKINGIAHIQLNVIDFPACREFYRNLLTFLEMQVVFDEPGIFYCVGGRTAVAITSLSEHEKAQKNSERGLDHYCFRMMSREDVDALYEFVLGLRCKVHYPPREGPWAPGYYSCSFFDPDGNRVEANFVPGKGNFDSSVKLPIPYPRKRGT